MMMMMMMMMVIVMVVYTQITGNSTYFLLYINILVGGGLNPVTVALRVVGDEKGTRCL
jgi:hypothetical protein